MTSKPAKPDKPAEQERSGERGAEGRRFGAPETKAVIDIGSNSIKLRVVRRKSRKKGGLETLVDRTELVRMGRGLDSGMLDESAMRLGVDVVRRMAGLAEALGAKPRLVGTMALRAARNAEDFVRWVREQTGMTVEILSEEKEAYLAWLGAVRAMGSALGPNAVGVHGGVVTVLDIGGGSTEVIFSAEGRITRSGSVPVGTVRLTEKFFTADPVPPGAAEAAIAHVRDAFVSSGAAVGPGESDAFVIGLGGGMLALASVKQKFPSFVPAKLHGTLLTRADVAVQRELYASMPLAERMKIAGLPPRRADIALAAACIAQCALDALRADSFRVSINGLRHGLLMEMFGYGVRGE
jgi:exopolyphosphatase/guanosine-5'-triphosphate,3'-diphosphate pyrophosphatase